MLNFRIFYSKNHGWGFPTMGSWSIIYFCAFYQLVGDREGAGFALLFSVALERQEQFLRVLDLESEFFGFFYLLSCSLEL